LPIYHLDERLIFPPPERAERNGLLAVGGDLRPERLLLAYSKGIFPWPCDDEDTPILWHSPDPRAVLLPAELHVARSLEKTMRKRPFELRLDTAFAEVIAGCAEIRRPGQRGTWITADMQEAYTRLFELGHAHSAEAWRADDASKIAFVTLVRQLARWGFSLVDCQQKTEHLTRFGAVMWRRSRFQAALAEALRVPGRPGPWRLDADLA
jgi:leucyl/phenylalanyl-tRNA--protein transferase